MPDDLTAPLDPDRIRDRTFSTVRRGADPSEVQAFLRRIATELASANERAAELQRQLDRIRSTPAESAPDPLDPSQLTKLLGEETTRVLDAAQAAAAEIRARAEEGVARLLHEAREEASEMREQAEAVLAERTERAEDAAARVREQSDAARERAEVEAARIIEESKREGRALVLEAQQMRKRLLDDLADRQAMMREQIEQLQAGRDRLMAAYDAVRESVSSATRELQVAFPTAEELADVEPIDDPDGAAPQLPTPAIPSSAAPVEVIEAPSEPMADERSDGASGDGDTTETVVVASDDSGSETVPTAPTSEPSAPTGPVRSPALPTAQRGSEVPPKAAPTRAPEVEAPKPERPPADPRPQSSSVRVVRTSSGKVADVFERLRQEGVEEEAQRSATSDVASAQPASSKSSSKSLSKSSSKSTRVAGDGGDEVTLDAVQSLIIKRDDIVAQVQAALSRRIKRELSDQQNEMLAAISSVRGTVTAHDILPMPEDHLERYDDLALPFLTDAAEAGAKLGKGRRNGVRSSIADISAALASAIVMPMRARLEATIAESGRDRDALAQSIRSTFREWKATNVDATVSLDVATAVNRGLLDAVGKGAQVHWVVADGDTPGPDCTQNAAAGSVVCGTAFPSGHVVPPTAPGCRCIVVAD